MSTAGALILIAVSVVLAGIGVLVCQRIVRPRRQRAAAALYAEVQLQLLTQAAMAALLDAARRGLLDSDRRPS